MAILQAKNQLQVAKYVESYTIFPQRSNSTHDLVLKVSCSESGVMASIPAGCWNSLQPLGSFCVARSSSVHWHARLYIAALSNIFFKFLLGFCQWQSRADRVLTLNMNIQLQLCWSTWSRAWGLDSATWAGLAHGQWLQPLYTTASEQKCWKRLGHCYSWIAESTKNIGPR